MEPCCQTEWKEALKPHWLEEIFDKLTFVNIFLCCSLICFCWQVLLIILCPINRFKNFSNIEFIKFEQNHYERSSNWHRL